MHKIPILYIIDEFTNLAGAERNLYEIVTRLDKDAFLPHIIALQGGQQLADELNAKAIHTRVIQLKRIYGLHAFIEAVKLFIFIKMKNIRIVVTYHESSDFWGGVISWLARVPVRISSRRDMGYKLRKRHIMMYRLVNAVFTRIITVSDAVKDVIFDREGALWSRMVTVYNGVELQKFNIAIDRDAFKKSLGIQPGQPVIGILAGLRPIKGHTYFFQAAARIHAQFPHAVFLVVGWYNENGKYYRSLVEQVKKLGIEKSVVFTGGRPDTPELISIMDISVFSSLNEGFSNAVVESMCMAKPVVATNSGGTPEAVVDNHTGRLVEPMNAEALAAAVIALLDNKALAHQMGETGKKRVLEKFTMETMVSNIECLYKRLLDEEKIYRTRLQGMTGYVYYFRKILRLLQCTLLFYTGVYSLLKQKNGIRILAYHKVADEVYDPLEMSIPVIDFEKQLRYIKKRYNPLSLQEAVSILKERRLILSHALAVTFDDGYKDNYINAYPLLKKYRIPAAIFLSVEALDNGKLLWYEQIVHVFKVTSQKHLDLTDQKLRRYELATEFQKQSACREVVNAAKYMPVAAKKALISQLFARLEVPDTSGATNDMLSWEDIKEMHRHGILFGSHGMTHAILTTLSSEDIMYEIQESRKTIREKAGVTVEYYCYPNGNKNDFNQAIKEIFKKSGIQAAGTLISGINTVETDIYALKRYCVTPGIFSGVFDSFSGIIFDYRLSGINR